MADDPNKKGADAKRISQQPHEQAYQKRKAKESGTKEKTSTGRGSSSRGSSEKDTSSRGGSSRS